MTPTTFKKLVYEVHEQWNYPPLTIRPFKVPPNFGSRVKKSIKFGKRNKLVGSDSLHTEMLQVDPNVCAEILTKIVGDVRTPQNIRRHMERRHTVPIFYMKDNRTT